MNAVGSPRLALYRLHEGLTWVSVGSVALSLLACVALALVRRRFDLALGAVVVIGGSNVTTQILKYHVITRPDLSQAPNSLPSGHTTVALSIALAAVIVAPSAWRSIVAIGVSATATLVGVATVLGRWHRPSDVVAATFVCLLWAALGLLTAALVGHRLSGNAPHVSVHLGALIGASAVGGLLVLWGVRPQAGMRDLGLGLISLGAIGLACAVSVAAVARIADQSPRVRTGLFAPWLACDGARDFGGSGGRQGGACGNEAPGWRFGAARTGGRADLNHRLAGLLQRCRKIESQW